MNNKEEQDKIVKEYKKQIDYFEKKKSSNLILNISLLNTYGRQLLFPVLNCFLFYLQFELHHSNYMLKIRIDRFTCSIFLNMLNLQNIYFSLNGSNFIYQKNDATIYNNLINWAKISSIEFIKVLN